MDHITLSEDQNEAVDRYQAWRMNPKAAQSFIIDGEAGCGKTTIAREFIAGEDRVICATPTGKAAYILGKKLEDLNVEVVTCHSLLYKPIPITMLDVVAAEKNLEYLESHNMCTKLAEWTLKKLTRLLEQGACEFGPKLDPEHRPLIIIDEASMVGPKMQRDIEAVAGRVVWLGDGGQLPSVGKEKDPVTHKWVTPTPFFERNKADATLTKQHRNAGSILKLAHHVRHGGTVETFKGWDKDCVLAEAGDTTALGKADQAITGMNVTRHKINSALRAGLGFSGIYPNQGEKILCKKNMHGMSILNGVMAEATKGATKNEKDELTLSFVYEGRAFENMVVDPFLFEQTERPSMKRYPDNPVDEKKPIFDFGHCITVHGAQGSEYDHVAVADDKMRIAHPEDRRRWCYTAATRAAKKLTWVNV